MIQSPPTKTPPPTLGVIIQHEIWQGHILKLNHWSMVRMSLGLLLITYPVPSLWALTRHISFWYTYLSIKKINKLKSLSKTVNCIMGQFFLFLIDCQKARGHLSVSHNSIYYGIHCSIGFSLWFYITICFLIYFQCINLIFYVYPYVIQLKI